jgi:hypothetical protein
MDYSIPVLDRNEACKQIREYLQSLGLYQSIIITILGFTEEPYAQKDYASGTNGLSQ